MEEAAMVFQKRTGIVVELIWGGSGTVLSQMKLARRGDLYIPGSPDFMDKAEKDGLVDPSSKRILAYLVPMICVQKGNPLAITGLADLAKDGVRVAIGNPETVCVGLYAVEILARANLLKAIHQNIVTYASSCSDTASLLALRKVDAVIGWDVFGRWNPDNIETIPLDPAELPRLAYIPAAITRDFCQNRPAAQAFIDFLVSPEGKRIFEKWGYIGSEKAARKYAPAATIGGDYRLPTDYYATAGK